MGGSCEDVGQMVEKPRARQSVRRVSGGEVMRS
jgi:hypothetical protein